jgi:hypothetical protein
MTENKNISIKYDWEFNVLNIYNYRKPGWFKQWFDFIKFNHASIKAPFKYTMNYKNLTNKIFSFFLIVICIVHILILLMRRGQNCQ